MYGITEPKIFAADQADPKHGLWPYIADHSLVVLIVFFFLCLD